jgi:hypothetical protein
MSAGKTLDTERVVSNLLETYLTPDWSEKRAEITAHEFVRLRRKGVEGQEIVGHPEASSWYKVMFTTSDTAVVQELETKWDGPTRFHVGPVPLTKWDATFVEWIDEDHARYQDARSCWAEGMRMYGADV